MQKEMSIYRTKTFRTARLLLRPLCRQDAPAAFEGWASDPEVTYYMPYNTHRSVQETEQWLAAEEAGADCPDRYNWGIVEQATGRLVGTIGLNRSGSACELGYCLARRCWKQGYMTEAVDGVLRYAWTELKPDTVYARVAVQNLRSARVLQKLGFEDAGACTYSTYDEAQTFASRKYVLQRRSG